MRLLAADGQQPFISAHRGYSAKAPENTMAALNAAWEAGAAVVEIDVRLSRDGMPVVFHDRNLDRTSDGHGAVLDKTWAELQELDAGSWFDDRFRGERIPSLDEVLAWTKGRIPLLVELKNFPERDPTFIDRVMDVFIRHNAADSAVICGSDHPLLSEIHARAPNWPLQMIYTARLTDPVGAARACGATLLCIEPQFCVAEDVMALHRAGIGVLAMAYCADDVHLLSRLGVDFIEADDIGMVQATLAEIKRR